MKLGRNDPCRCGSGQKYKKCCLPKDDAAQSAEFAKAAAAAAEAAKVAEAEAEAEGEESPGAAKVTAGTRASDAARRPATGGGAKAPTFRRKAI
jgi:hypothetical protein